MIPELVSVTQVEKENADVVTLTLSRPKFHCKPGQFNMLYAFGKGEVPISIADWNEENLIHTIKGVGPVSQGLCELAPGDQIGLRGPFGRGWPDIDGNRTNLIIAGGLGLAPLTATINQLAVLNQPENAILVYGCRTPADQMFQSRLERWNKSLQVFQTVDIGDRKWQGEVGNVLQVLPRLNIPWHNTRAYVCGPEVMMRFCAQTLMELNCQDIYLSFERNMKCAFGHCGHCQLGPTFVCKDGPVYAYDDIRKHWQVREL